MIIGRIDWGDVMLVGLPSGFEYAEKVVIEQEIFPKTCALFERQNSKAN
jgi:hypothetical protein